MFKINGITVRKPSSFNESDVKLERGGRTANGTLVKDIVAIKKEIDASYSVIKNSHFESIMGIIKDNHFISLEYDNYSGEFFVSDISYTLLVGGENKLWADFSFKLIEV